MIPKQEPTLMDVLANCLMDIDGSFQEWQMNAAKSAQSKRCSKPGFSGSKQCPAKFAAKPNHFNATFDLSQFDPSEINVKMEENILSVYGKHELSNKDGNYEYREYVKKLPVPVNVLTDQLKCTVDQSGRLLVEAPLANPDNERVIPVQFVTKKMETDQVEPKDAVVSDVPEVAIEDVGTD